MIRASDLVAKFQYALDNRWGYIWGAAGILWTSAKQKQKIDYMVSKYGTSWKTNSEAKNDNYYYSAKDGTKWINHYVADCSGLFAWAFKQLGGAIAHGSNSIWDRYCSSKGKLKDGRRTDGQPLLPGTAFFVYKAEKDNRSHIGLYIGNGLVIEAAGTNDGVITSSVAKSKWAEWGQLKDVSYEGIEPGPEPVPPVPPEPDVRPTLRRGNKGPYVKEAQELLLKLGYPLPRYGADGDFGAETENAVKTFQKEHALSIDGVIGKRTWEALLDGSPRETLYAVTISGLDLTQARALCNNYPGATMKEM
jgi:hypothetical protein